MRTIQDVFTNRTCYKFQSKQVSIKLLHQIYDLMKLGPTSGNSCPLRIVFVQSEQSKTKLKKCVMDGNIDKINSAPVTALFAYDSKFYNHMDKTNPTATALKDYFIASASVATDTAIRNSTLQAAYFMIIARSFGLDCGPMSGFNAALIEQEFLVGDNFKINFICNLGYRDGENTYPRLPRLDFADICKLI